MGRIVVEHPDGRRAGCPEEGYDDPKHNPYNHPTDIVSGEFNGRPIVLAHDEGRPVDDHVSLKDEGFAITHRINDKEYIDKETGNVVPVGAEVAIDDDHRKHRAMLTARHAKPSEHGAKMAEEHKQRRARLGIPNFRDVGWEIPE